MSDVLLTFCGFSSVAGLTWFFASRRRLMIRMFLPRHQIFRARITLREPNFEKEMRTMAALQFAMAIMLTIGVAAWHYFN